MKNVLHQANCERSNMESKIKGRVERKNNTPEPQLTKKNKKFRLNNRITAQKNKPTTKFKLQQPCRNSECRVLLWSVHLLIRSLTAGGQKSRYVSYVTFGTSICLWSSNRQIIVCVPLKKKKKKKAAQFHEPLVGGGQVGWRGMAMSWVEKHCCVCWFVCYKNYFSVCCCLSEPSSPPSAGNSSAERRLSRAPCVKNYVR